jgi:hypothetical protein
LIHYQVAATVVTCNILIVCTRIYRFFNPERDDESSDYHLSSSSSGSSSFRHRFRNCFFAFFPLLKRDDTPTTGRVRESRRVITRMLSLSWFSFRSPFSSRQTRKESNGRLSFSNIESGEFNFESRADMEVEAQKRSNQKLEGERDRSKGGEDEKTRAKKSILPGVLSSPSLPPSTPSSAPTHPDLDRHQRASCRRDSRPKGQR